MEYEWEANDKPGDVPEFGAIFMSNIATKRECFKWKVFALPSSMANFVKQVKEGMVLFLFEYEKRQLFGVFRAISDGAINIVPHAFSSSGKQFPAQVRFTPIWSCRPLFENEFRDAIRENYFSAKKFHFGLSEKQVRRLLQLFNTRRKLNNNLPPRQLARFVTRTASKDRRRVDNGLSIRRERLEMEHSEDDFSLGNTDEFLEYAPDTATEAYEEMISVDDRIENRKKTNALGNNFLTDQAGDFLHKREILYENKPETELHDKPASLFSYGNDKQEVSLDKERMPLTAENTDHDHNIYTSFSPSTATKYSGGTCNLARRTEYDRLFFESANRNGVNDDRFLLNDSIEKNLDTTEKNLDLHDIFRPPVSCVNEENLGIPGRAAGDYKFLVDNRSSHKLLTGERIASEHNLDNELQLDFLPLELQNPFDSDQSTFDQRRFLQRNKVMEANYRDGLNGSTTSYMPSEYERIIPRLVADNGLMIKKKVDNIPSSHLEQNLSDCFSKPCPDSQFSRLKGPRRFKTLNATFHDSTVTRTIPAASELPIFHRKHYLPIKVDQGARLALDNPYYGSGGDYLALSTGKSSEGEGFERCDHASDFGSENFYPANLDLAHCHAAQVPRNMKFMCSAPPDDSKLVFCPYTCAPVPLTESLGLNSLKSSLEPDSSSVLSQEMKHIYCRQNDERMAGKGVLSSNPKLVGLDVCHEAKLTNDGVECYKSYNTGIKNEDGQHCLNPQGGYPDSGKQRRSVFTRLTLTQRACTWEEKEKDADTYLDKSVDEVMGLLNASQSFRMRNLRKNKSGVIQHNREELPRTDKMLSPEMRFTAPKLEQEASQAFEEGSDDLLKETRAVEFKRRSELKKNLDENGRKGGVLNLQGSRAKDIQEITSKENAEPEGPMNKRQKRRKLVRPVFTSSNVSVDRGSDSQNLVSQS